MRLATALLLTLPLLLPAQTPRRPKLIVAITVDQFRYDYLTRFRDKYTGGFNRLLTQGAVFTNAYYEHYPTVTAIGHSTYLTGATPSVSGIIANEWWDRASGKQIASVEDETVTTLGGKGRAGKAASPRRMLTSTVGDELKMAGRDSKVIGISVKDRSAILPAGHMADGAYWLDNESGNIVSSTYYFKQLPPWVQDFNKTRMVDKWAGTEWKPLEGGEAFKKIATTLDKAYYEALEKTPYSNELMQKLAEAAILGEQLGRHNGTDLLAVSFSGNDFVGHEVGPDHPQVRDISIRTDRMLGELFRFIETQVGMRNVLVVLTADHGVAPVPEVNQQRKMPGGRIISKNLGEHIQKHLVSKFGEGKWAVKSEMSIYLDYALIAQKKLDPRLVAEEAAAAAREHPHIFRAYTRDQLMRGAVPGDQFDKRVLNGFHYQRSADVILVQDPYYLYGGKVNETSHGSPFGYDAHVPVIFMGDWIKAGRYHQRIKPNDIAPTLATLLDVEVPSGSVGRTLDEIIIAPAPLKPKNSN